MPGAKVRTEAPHRMPWTVSEQDFTEGCTRCGKCVEACETAIIITGDGGFPEVDFQRGECTFCGVCADACPVPVFVSREQSPWQKVAEIGESCLSFQSTECRSCRDMCEYSAIRFRLQAGNVAQPVLDVDECSGCGACIKPCPVNAITMSDNNN
ncbi:ferredoxin-type protein NapF [Vibrio albus]|uniref:Ferredoxin-type protein NapF n=2 Tax=Vibrio albus TaxID=2200953 RepID=A0A2U3B8V6_9VIBR|nr:ferredoxin-type protein NapF [Vibrio albus]PWI33213.1 ferredoxin-type protein NapF [Vibrio albus]